MAYFTDNKDIEEGEFQMTQDTVEISVDDPGPKTVTITEGESDIVGWHINNTGRKPVWIRVKLEKVSGSDDAHWDIASEDEYWKQGNGGDDYYYYYKLVERKDSIPVDFEINAVTPGNVELQLTAEAVQEANNGYTKWLPAFPFNNAAE